ncbi:hypothetical protein ID866_5584 [Astraeus odoratus]|nr:hypothetical protein ID866_5584 [Astraeus odoratus]
MIPTLSKRLRRVSVTTLSVRCKSSRAHHDVKMNALVSIYHQSDRFITPETLSDAIDQAFTTKDNFSDDKRKYSCMELLQMRTQQRQAPKFFLGKDQSFPSISDSSGMGPGWTESKERRVDRVCEALMGTTRNGKPSWSGVKANSERVMAQLAADRARHE